MGLDVRGAKTIHHSTFLLLEEEQQLMNGEKEVSEMTHLLETEANKSLGSTRKRSPRMKWLWHS